MRVDGEENLPVGIRIVFNVIIMVVVGTIVLGTGYVYEYTIVHNIEMEKARNIYMFFILPISLFTGVAIAKAIVTYYAYPTWKRRQNNKDQ